MNTTNKLKKEYVSVFGDIILDKFTYCENSRLNPEAPTLLVNAKRSEYKLGGCSNVANNLKALNIEPILYGIIGRDEAGRKIEELTGDIEQKIIYSSTPTILKERFVSEHYGSQILRVDYEEKENLTQSGLEEIINYFNKNPTQYTIISDYNKGMITKDLVEYLKSTTTKIFVDPKPENIDLYYDVYLIKPNLSEASQIYGKKIENTNEAVAKAGLELVKKYRSNFIITRSDKGSTLITKDRKVKHITQNPVEVYDVTGAGDTYISALVYGLIKTGIMNNAINIAQNASKLVVQKPGTAVIREEELFKY